MLAHGPSVLAHGPSVEVLGGGTFEEWATVPLGACPQRWAVSSREWVRSRGGSLALGSLLLPPHPVTGPHTGSHRDATHCVRRSLGASPEAKPVGQPSVGLSNHKAGSYKTLSLCTLQAQAPRDIEDVA